METRTVQDPFEGAASRGACSLPMRLELDAVCHILGTLHPEGHACLSVGFHAGAACRRLRESGGYWTYAVTDPESGGRLSADLGADAAVLDPRDGLPFEDKQFDVAVIALGTLNGDHEADTALIRECHRVLKAPSYLILTVEYEKPLGLADLINRRTEATGQDHRYSEAALFDLLKTGFDWLGLRSFSRFWVQLIWTWADRRRMDPTRIPRLHGLYLLARVLDAPLFFTRGYLVTVYGRRKGWRPRLTPTLSDGRSISEAVLHPLGR